MKGCLTALFACALLLTGCGLPSSWRVFDTPLERQEKRVAQESQARNHVLAGAQAAAHQTVLALESAPPSRATEVAMDFAAEAQTLLDQAQGAPLAGDVARWQGLVDRLLSDNQEIRTSAERERVKDREAIAAVADKLAQATAARVRAEAQVREYAKENERLADMVRKAFWIVGGLAGLWLASQALAIAARFNPALAGVSGLVNGIAAPAVQFAASRAQQGLHRIGTALATVRREAPAVAAQVIPYLDAETDRDHQAEIRRAAEAAP